MSALCSLAAQLEAVREQWAGDPRLQPQSLRVGRLAGQLAPLLHRSIFHLKLSDPQYLRGNGMGWSPISSGTKPLGLLLK